MIASLGLSWAIDGWIVLAGVLSAVSAALLGNYLVLRKMSMLGDAISHAVLPGLAAAFLLTGVRHSLPMFIGAVLVGVLTAVFTEWIHRYGRVDEGASMGVVFTSLFAAGLLMIVRAADHVDLDPGCVLYGAIELTPLDTWTIAGLTAPRVVYVLTAVLLLNLAFVVLLFKELRISSFDPGLATTVGVNSGLMHYLLMTLVAVTAVACFEAVGNILVVAMFVVPPATAYLLTNRLGKMVALSTVIAALAAVLGHFGSIVGPRWFGFASTNTAGTMAVATGVLFVVALIASPRAGLIARFVRRQLLWLQVIAEDLLGVLYRSAERGNDRPMSAADLAQRVGVSRASIALAALMQRRRGLIAVAPEGYRLTEQGVAVSKQLVRSHRLWEAYLVEQVGMDAAATHPQAERFEHITNRELRDRLDEETRLGELDPHGKPIPTEPPSDS